MIRNFADHSANERTFLAWIRTAVALMGFGFIVEKLGLSGPSGNGQPQQALIAIDHIGNYTGIALILAGLALVIGATIRFLALHRLLEESGERTGVSVAIDLSLAVLVVLLGIALAVYLLHLALH